jgi:outer membrane protein insertion porin family/translocation and assembly module TamA
LEFNTPFTYSGVLDPALGPLVISYVGLFGAFDLTGDPTAPRKGLFLSADVQTAGGPLGGDARDYKLQPEARFYVPVTKKVTLGVRGAAGFVFPRNYGSSIEPNAEFRRPPAGMARDAWVRDVQLSFFRALFSGGPNSNRGYPLRGVGPHGVVPFFQPNVAAQQLQDNCEPQSPDYDSARCALPLGGLTLWEASVDLRFPISGQFTGATFCDTSDVAPTQLSFRFDRPHLSCGLGARYGTPVGPIRLDFGYRIPGMQTLRDDAGEGVPPTLLGLPVAVHIAIGEAF